MYIPNPMSFVSLNVFPNIATQWPLRQLRTIQFTDSRDAALRSMEKQRHMTRDIGSLGCPYSMVFSTNRPRCSLKTILLFRL